MDTQFHFAAANSVASSAAAAIYRPALYAMTSADDDLKSLAAGLRRRDPEVIDRLIEQYQHRLFRYLVYLAANRERAEDFFQETWIRVLERGHQYDGKSRFDVWLFAIARHLVIDSQRKKKMESLDALSQDESSAPAEPADETPSALSLLLTNEEAAAVQASLAGVPAIHREVLLLRFQEDMALSDISGVLGVPLATVKSRLYRGLENLRSLLTGERA